MPPGLHCFLLQSLGTLSNARVGSATVAVERKSSALFGSRCQVFLPLLILVHLTVGQGVVLKLLIQMQQGSPAVVTSLVPRRIQLPSSRDAMRVDESSDTSVEASQHSRFRQRAPHGPNPSNSPDEDNPVDLSATQATFLAGAAVTQAHHAATIADHASHVAIQSQLEAFQARQVIAQQQSDFGQVAAEMRDAAARAILHNQEEAQAALAERGTGVRSCLSITSLNRPNN